MNRKRLAALALAGAIAGGGAAAIFVPALASGQTSPPAATQPGGKGHGQFGGHHETVSDLSLAAQAIGISEADLKTALGSGQTMAQVAQAHNVAAQKVVDALVADQKKELADAVAAGHLTQAQADQKSTGLADQITAMVNGQFPKGGPGHAPGHAGAKPAGPFGGHHEAVSDLGVAAQAIGISEADLKTALGSGQSMAQVAQAHNVTAQTVVDALVADQKKKLADEVAAGHLSQAQADKMSAGVADRIAAMVNGQFPKGGPGHRPR